MKKTVLTLYLFSLFIFSFPAKADKLLITGINEEPPNSAQGVPRPRSGMTSAKVVEIFGQPKAKSDPVGSPPISRWVYDKFIVVFEDEHVINSIVKKTQFSDLKN